MKRYIIFGLIFLVIIGSVLAPKILKQGDQEVKYKIVLKKDIPPKIKEMLPTYIMEERALSCKYEEDVYIVVTRGEKKSRGYGVEIEKIIEENHTGDKFDIRVFVKFKDPNPNEVLPQEYSYPYIIVRTKLKNIPERIYMETRYD